MTYNDSACSEFAFYDQIFAFWLDLDTCITIVKLLLITDFTYNDISVLTTIFFVML